MAGCLRCRRRRCDFFGASLRNEIIRDALGGAFPVSIGTARQRQRGIGQLRRSVQQFALHVCGIWLICRAGIRRDWSLANAKREATTATTDLDAFRAESQRLHGISVDLDARIATLAAQQPKIIERWNRETVVNPAPADCRPGAERLRAINAAIEAANAAIAGQPVPAMPSD